MSNIYETLPEEAQVRIDATVNVVKNAVDGDIDVLMAILEKLNEVKKQIRELNKVKEKENKAAEKADKAAAGAAYVATLHEGDLVTFRYGLKGANIATLPILKIGAKSVRVVYPPEMLEEGSKTNERNVLFDKIIVK